MDRSRFTIGIALIAVGALFAVDALELWDTGEVVARWWPFILVVLGGARMLSRPSDYVGGVAMMLFGVILLDGTANIWPGNAAALIWPLLLVGAGTYLILRPREADRWTGHDVLQIMAVFSGRRVVSSADPFRGAVATAIFGGIELDLRPASIGPEPAFVDATAAFGGIKLIVPPDWKVVMSGPAIFGGNENKTEALGPLPRTAPVLNVRALALFGGVEVVAPATRVGIAPAEAVRVGGGMLEQEEQR